MKYVKLGNSGLEVSQICLGCMSFGESGMGTHAWTLNEETSRQFMKKSLDAGINFFDTAEGYPVPPDAKWVGRTEEFVGRWMKTKPRDAIIMATKVSGPSLRITSQLVEPQLRSARKLSPSGLSLQTTNCSPS